MKGIRLCLFVCLFVLQNESEKSQFRFVFSERRRFLRLETQEPSPCLHLTISIITLIDGTAIAGAVGVGGFSDLALRYDYIQWDTPGIKATFIFLIIIVQLIQSLDTKSRKKLMKLRA